MKRFHDPTVEAENAAAKGAANPFALALGGGSADKGPSMLLKQASLQALLVIVSDAPPEFTQFVLEWSLTEINRATPEYTAGSLVATERMTVAVTALRNALEQNNNELSGNVEDGEGDEKASNAAEQ